ncbi:MAG: hypothetical protein KF820_02510 [Candidatus Paracaedibacteraceae bacterium]|nr:hypothetical protein [Candidatus Paracaedibacteraceae bacterium]
MVKFLILLALMTGSSFAKFSDYLPWNRPTTPTLKNLLALQDARDAVTEQRKQATTAINTMDLQELRRQIRLEDDQIEQLRQEFDQRLDNIRRDYIGLRNDLQNRMDKRTQDYKDAQRRLKRQKKLIDFVATWSKRYAILAKNLIDLKNKLLEDYNEELIKRYNKTSEAIIQANADLIANWKDQITDTTIQNLSREIKKHIIARDKLIKQLQQKLRARLFTVSTDSLASLKTAVKTANCPAIRDIGQTNDPNMIACFVQALTKNPPIQNEECQPIIIPGARSKKQAIDPSRPLDAYLACAKSVTQGKAQISTIAQSKRTPLRILLDLEENRRILQDLSSQERTGMANTSRATVDRQRQENQLQQAYKDYQTSLEPLREKLRSLDKQLSTIIDLARAHLNSILDQTYVLEQDNTELTDALMQEGGADKIQDIVIAMVQKSLTDKAKEFALYLLNQIPGSTFVLQIDPKHIQSALRQVIDTATRDRILARQFMKSQILSAPMEQALKILETKYPNFEVDQAILRVHDKQGVFAKVCNIGKGFTEAISRGANAVINFCTRGQPSQNSIDEPIKSQREVYNTKILEEGLAKTSLQALAPRSKITLTNTRTDITALGCPYITGLGNLTQSNIEKCARWALDPIPKKTQDQFPSCYPWLASGHMQCVKDIQQGRPVSPQIQLGFLVNQLQTGILAQTGLATADKTVRSSNSIINQLKLTKRDLASAIEKLTTFQTSWIEKRRQQIQSLKARRDETQKNYDELSSKLTQIQEGWVHYLLSLTKMNDMVTAVMSLMTTSIMISTVPQENPNLAKDVNTLKALLGNLNRGISDLEERMNNFDSDSRYQRDSKRLRESINKLLNTLETLQIQLDTLLSHGTDVMEKADNAIKLLNCQWFPNIGAGQRGLSQCLSAIGDRVHQLGQQLKKPECLSLDFKSRYIQSDLDKCAHRQNYTVNEGDIIKGGNIIKGMDAKNTDAMLDKLMLDGGYSRDQATEILKGMMIL